MSEILQCWKREVSMIECERNSPWWEWGVLQQSMIESENIAWSYRACGWSVLRSGSHQSHFCGWKVQSYRTASWWNEGSPWTDETRPAMAQTRIDVRRISSAENPGLRILQPSDWPWQRTQDGGSARSSTGVGCRAESRPSRNGSWIWSSRSRPGPVRRRIRRRCWYCWLGRPRGRAEPGGPECSWPCWHGSACGRCDGGTRRRHWRWRWRRTARYRPLSLCSPISTATRSRILLLSDRPIPEVAVVRCETREPIQYRQFNYITKVDNAVESRLYRSEK